MTTSEILIDQQYRHTPLRLENPLQTFETNTLGINDVLKNKPELPGFIAAWRHKPKKQATEELSSYCLETQRISDPYWYFLTPGGELYSPSANCRVKDVIKTNTHVGSLEYQEIENREALVRNNDQGVIVWLSPLDDEFYPTDAKITISEIGDKDGIEGILNRSIILDIDQKRCFELAQDLVKFSTNRPLLSSIDLIRSNDFLLDTKGIHWTYILEELIPELHLDYIRKGLDLEKKKETLEKAAEILNTGSGNILAELGKSQMVGRFTTSCPVRMNSETSILGGEAEYFECPKCQGHIPKGKGITVCPHCGCRKEDCAAQCD